MKKHNILNFRSCFLFLLFHICRVKFSKDKKNIQKKRGLPCVFVSYIRLKLQRN